MDKEPLIRLAWHGDATISVIRRLIGQAERIEISLPHEYNHALFRVLHPDARPSALEVIDTSAGPEILDAIAKIRGLEGLAALTTLLDRANASVAIFSPPTLLIDTNAGASGQQPLSEET